MLFWFFYQPHHTERWIYQEILQELLGSWRILKRLSYLEFMYVHPTVDVAATSLRAIPRTYGSHARICGTTTLLRESLRPCSIG